MTDSNAPKPWLDGGPADPLLSRVLASATSDEPGANDLQALGKKLEIALVLAPATLIVSAANIKAGVAGAATGSSAKVFGGVALWKLGVGVVVASGLVGGGIHYSRGSGGAQLAGSPSHAARGATQVHALIPSPSIEVPTAEPAPVPIPRAAPVVAPRQSHATPASTTPAASMTNSAAPAAAAAPAATEASTSAAPTKPVPTPPTPGDEIALVERAQKNLRHGSASLALALANRHEKEHPNGAVAQESEAIAIEALYRLGRRSEADARRARFRARFPGSPHLRRLDALATRAATTR